METESSTNMDWVKPFYRLQNQWLEVYMGDLNEWHLKRVETFRKLQHKQGTLDVLELGAGGGQTSVAIANEGHRVVSIELLEELVEHSKTLATTYPEIDYTPLQGDFYTIDLEQQFDVVCYFDSFGIGSDADQTRLLKRVANWLKPDGVVMLEVGTPWYWANDAKGKQTDLGDYIRRYDFDAATCRMLDYWYPKAHPEQVVYQRLRCYSPMDLQLVLQGTGLTITDEIIPTGKIDYEREWFVEDVELHEAMTYYIKLKKV